MAGSRSRRSPSAQSSPFLRRFLCLATTIRTMTWCWPWLIRQSPPEAYQTMPSRSPRNAQPGCSVNCSPRAGQPGWPRPATPTSRSSPAQSNSVSTLLTCCYVSASAPVGESAGAHTPTAAVGRSRSMFSMRRRCRSSASGSALPAGRATSKPSPKSSGPRHSDSSRTVCRCRRGTMC